MQARLEETVVRTRKSAQLRCVTVVTKPIRPMRKRQPADAVEDTRIQSEDEMLRCGR